MVTTVLFDLDGTLVDTAPELADALNATLREQGLATVDEALVRSWIGDGARALLGKALRHLNAPPELDAPAWDAFALHYAQACGTRSHVHDGVRGMLDRLRQAGCRLAVLTNKESGFAHRVLAAHDLSSAFELIVAGDTLKVRKPDPAVVQHALQALDATAEEAVLIGDSVLDVRCARAAGIRVWVVRHGYPAGALTGENQPDALIDHFDQVGRAGPSVASEAAPCDSRPLLDLPRRTVIA